MRHETSVARPDPAEGRRLLADYRRATTDEARADAREHLAGFVYASHDREPPETDPTGYPVDPDAFRPLGVTIDRDLIVLSAPHSAEFVELSVVPVASVL